MDSNRTLKESRLAVLVEKLNPSQLDDGFFRVLDAVHELLGLLGHWGKQDERSKDSSPNQTLLNFGVHALCAAGSQVFRDRSHVRQGTFGQK